MAQVNEFTNVDNTGNGVNLSDGDSVFIAGGVSIAGGINGSLNNGLSSSGGNITAQIFGNVWGEQYGIHFASTTESSAITVGEGGSVIGATKDGIKLDADSSGVINHGEIDGASNSSGINFSGSEVSLVNSGVVAGYVAVSIVGGGDTIENTGDIVGARAGIVISTDTDAVNTTIANSGHIEGQSTTGAISDQNTAGFSLENSGSIIGTVHTNSAGFNLNNSGEIYGSVQSVNAAGTNSIQNDSAGAMIAAFVSGTLNTVSNSGHIGILSFNAGTSQVTNSGSLGDVDLATLGNKIVNSGTVGTIQIDGATPVNGQLNVIKNSGTITAIGSVTQAIESSGGAMQVVNTGSILGDIQFGTGDHNFYQGSHGTVTGLVIAGDGDNTFTGGSGNERFDLTHGLDVLNAGAGDDTISIGTNFNAGQTIDGGDGNDTLSLSGDYGGGVRFEATTIVNVETLVLHGSNSYRLITDDANVAAGKTLTVNAGSLTATDKLTFDGSAETNGNFNITGGHGADIITTGAGADMLNGGAGNDTLNGGKGADHMIGGKGNDIYVVDNAGDVVTEKSGGGTDTVKTSLASYTLGAHVEDLIYTGSGHFTGTGNSAANTITGGAHGNTLKGGGGADHLTGGAGSDTFVYTAASDSTGAKYDTVNGFNASHDKFNVTGTISGISAAITAGKLSTATFDANLASAVNASHLHAHHAVEFTASSGTLKGDHFLVVDLNGTAGYQAGHDLVVLLGSATNLTHLTTGDFI